MEATPMSIEKFSPAELSSLKNELMQGGLDSWQAAELLSIFLAGRGYGVSNQNAREAVTRMEVLGCSLECMQAELEQLAYVM